jgi:hypothetical protein
MISIARCVGRTRGIPWKGSTRSGADNSYNENTGREDEKAQTRAPVTCQAMPASVGFAHYSPMLVLPPGGRLHQSGVIRS